MGAADTRRPLPAKRQRLKDALLAYCRQDTLAMVKILKRLRAGSFGPSRA